MKKKNSLILDDEFTMYCDINKIENVEKLAKETFNRGFTLLKYGETPYGVSSKEKIVEVVKEVIVEKIVEVIKEVPVEKIVEKEIIVEVIKEVPVEVKGDERVVTKEVIKEIQVEVIKEVVNNEEIEKLKEENEKLKTELDTIRKSLEVFSKGRYMKNSDLSSLYDE